MCKQKVYAISKSNKKRKHFTFSELVEQISMKHIPCEECLKYDKRSFVSPYCKMGCKNRLLELIKTTFDVDNFFAELRKLKGAMRYTCFLDYRKTIDERLQNDERFAFSIVFSANRRCEFTFLMEPRFDEDVFNPVGVPCILTEQYIHNLSTQNMDDFFEFLHDFYIRFREFLNKFFRLLLKKRLISHIPNIPGLYSYEEEENRK